MFCFIVCFFFFKVGANKKTPLCDTSIICSNKARTGLHSDLFSVFGLQSSTHIQPLTSFHPVGIDGREGFEQAHAEYRYSPPQMRSHDEHVLCGPQRVCLAEKGHPALRPTFFRRQLQGKPDPGILCFILQLPCLCPFDLGYCLAELWGLCVALVLFFSYLRVSVDLLA